MKLYKSFAKVNIFLKITGKRDNYHELFSRFMKVSDLYDEISFQEKTAKGFTKETSAKQTSMSGFILLGNFNCEVEQNTIYKAYKALQEYTSSDALAKLIDKYAIKVEKKIPSFAGLGGGSSNAACFLKMCNNSLDLGLSLKELAHIGSSIGADVPFFIYDYNSANVSGIGEIVEKFDEEPLVLEINTPKIEGSTPKVYQCFREHFYKELSPEEHAKLALMSSKEILLTYTISDANDLFEPALQLYPELKNSYQKGYFFSGSGSTFFRIKP